MGWIGIFCHCCCLVPTCVVFWANVHWIMLTTSSVTSSTWLQHADLFVPKSLTAKKMLKKVWLLWTWLLWTSTYNFASYNFLFVVSATQCNCMVTVADTLIKTVGGKQRIHDAHWWLWTHSLVVCACVCVCVVCNGSQSCDKRKDNTAREVLCVRYKFSSTVSNEDVQAHSRTQSERREFPRTALKWERE